MSDSDGGEVASFSLASDEQDDDSSSSSSSRDSSGGGDDESSSSSRSDDDHHDREPAAAARTPSGRGVRKRRRGREHGKKSRLVGGRKRGIREAARDERCEWTDTLEHLIVVGGHNRHESWRIQQWKRLRAQELPARGLQSPLALAHLRDEREYGFGDPPPRLKSDEEWDAERFGNGVHLLHLYDGARSSPDATRDAIRLAVLRAWERAMSVASHALPVPIPPSSPSSQDPSAADPRTADGTEGQHLAATGINQAARPRRVRLSPTPSMAVAMCDRLQICLAIEGRSCPTCEVEFETPERAATHYYGTEAVRGCCWKLIHRRQRAVLYRALQNQVVHQAGQMLQALAVQYSSAPRHTRWDWQDVLGALTRTVNAATTATVATPPPEGLVNLPAGVAQTMLVEEHKPPIVLNRMVLHAAMRQLVERYANVPR